MAFLDVLLSCARNWVAARPFADARKRGENNVLLNEHLELRFSRKLDEVVGHQHAAHSVLVGKARTAQQRQSLQRVLDGEGVLIST